MPKSYKVIAISCLASLILLAGCYEPGGPVPEGAHKAVKRDYTQQQVDAVVLMEEQVISSPLPPAWGAPPECNQIHFLRFRPRDGSTLDPRNRNRVNTATTAAMLLMLPGFDEGANGFEYLARQLIYMAKVQNGVNMEVWAVERRNNRLEDLSAANYLEEGLATGKMTLEQAAQVAIDYYYNGKPLNGKSFKGFLLNEDVPFLSEFGLKLDTEDVFTVIQTMVPDPNMRKKKVFVGGHSMGGIMTSFFAGWDRDGNPATPGDAGYNNCAGLFGFDTLVTPSNELVKKFLGWLPDVSESNYMDLVTGLREGVVPVIVNSPPYLDAEIMSLLEALSIAAYYKPDDECTLVHKFPYSGNAELLIGLLHSRDLETFLAGVPELRDFRYTNEALLGAVFDDDFVPVGMIQNSMGFLQGGPVVKKNFPYMDWFDNIPFISDMLKGFLGGGTFYIPNDAGPCCLMLGCGPLYSWVNFDEVGDARDPNYQDKKKEITYTTVQNEVSDIRDVARALHKGPLNLVEWYGSTRIQIDCAGAMMSYGPKYGLNFLHPDQASALPQVVFLAGEGMMQDSMYNSVIPAGSEFIEGYNHMDVLMASASTTSRRPNEVIRPLIDFILQTIE